MKRLSKKIISAGLAFSMIFSASSFVNADNDDFMSDEQIEDLGNYQSEIRSVVDKELDRIFKDIGELYNYGSLYWDKEILTLAIKPETLTEELKVQIEELKEKDLKGFAVKEIDYTTNELIELLPKVKEVYLATEDESDYIGAGVKDDIGKVSLTVKSISEETKSNLEEKFPNRVWIDENENHVGPVPANNSIKYNDVLKNTWYYDDVINLSNKGIISGYPDGDFKPDNYITREEVSQIAYKVVKASQMEEKGKDKTEKDFKDVDKDRWSYEAIKFLKENDIVKGRTEDEFSPEDLITREEVAVIADRLEGYIIEVRQTIGYDASSFADGSEVSDWAQYSVGYLANHFKDPIINGYEDGTFRPHNNITRAEVSKIMNKLLDTIEDYYEK